MQGPSLNSKSNTQSHRSLTLGVKEKVSQYRYYQYHHQTRLQDRIMQLWLPRYREMDIRLKDDIEYLEKK
jgi:hypothetical protein